MQYRGCAHQPEVSERLRRRHAAVCFNPLEAGRQKSHREDLLNELEAEPASLADLARASHTQRVCASRTSAHRAHLLKEAIHRLAID